MFKSIWQLAFPLSVAFYAGVVFEQHKLMAITLGTVSALIGVLSFRRDRKEEQNESYKRLNYAIKRLNNAQDARMKELICHLEGILAKEEKDG